MLIQHFFSIVPRQIVKHTPIFTSIIVPEESSDGSTVFVEKVAELQTNPYQLLSFEDFMLSNMLKSGVSYKALNLQHDHRLGMDSEIDAFNEHLESIASELFNNQSNEQTTE